jgi:hypothetical protein
MTAWLHLFLDTPRDSFDEATRFWSATIGWQPSPVRGEDGQFLTLLPRAGSAYVKLQAVDGPAGVHLDLDTADRAASVETARRLGATTAWRYHDVEVMRSPGGFVFCQTLLDGSPTLVRDGRTTLDQVCLDVPAGHWDREVAFWRDLVDREVQAVPDEDEFLRLRSDVGLRILLQRLDEPTGPVRAHPDFASADREADTRRHVDLGARLERVHHQWTVLTAPGGQVYCLTDRDPRG